eukprot:65086-Hanusia_phi.AAC.6
METAACLPASAPTRCSKRLLPWCVNLNKQTETETTKRERERERGREQWTDVQCDGLGQELGCRGHPHADARDRPRPGGRV